ncbi:hypothetical protein [Siminovitchia fortis]|nr:hypothetical protein [Siminovitchia fortis]
MDAGTISMDRNKKDTNEPGRDYFLSFHAYKKWKMGTPADLAGVL